MPTSTESTLKCDLVPFVEWSGELMYAASLRYWSTEGGARASLNRAVELHTLDPKPGDLSMSRLKVR